jgi:acyl-CoA thioester hydrolase
VPEDISKPYHKWEFINNMIQHTTTIRVRYSETDRMGYVYYGNYPQYYEVGRVETLRNLGFPYKKLEDSGILLPVRDLSIRYYKPAIYDQLLTIETIIPEMPQRTIRFDYNILDEEKTRLNSGSTTLVFVKAESMRPCKIPEFLEEVLKPHFK